MQVSHDDLKHAFIDLARKAYGEDCVVDVELQDVLDPQDRHAYRVDIILTDEIFDRPKLSMIQLNRDAMHWLESHGVEDLAVIMLRFKSERDIRALHT